MAKAKTVLIVGGSGLIGTHLALALRDQYKVFATYKTNPIQIPGVTCIPIDLENELLVKRVIYTVAPDVLVFAAGSNDPEWVDEHATEADTVHVGSLTTLGNAIESMPIRFIYLSNGYVFDGLKGNYRENELGISPNLLGKIKIAAENFVRGRFFNHVIIRSGPLLGRSAGGRLSFFDQLRRNLERGVKVELSHSEYHCYLPVQALVDLIKKNLDYASKYKVIHYNGLTKLTPYEFGLIFAERFRFSSHLIQQKTSPEKKANTETGKFDFSLNSSLAIQNLNAKPFFLEQSLNLLEKLLIPRS